MHTSEGKFQFYVVNCPKVCIELYFMHTLARSGQGAGKGVVYCTLWWGGARKGVGIGEKLYEAI